ncbi:hypothetical protein FE257_005682 [Aspergillus nanangensis]|uniref:Major facilitator superfamily (MFS) profile domain-containing protein n=1 Tax=Aspergillus nanangensis TaxID=2582783 RepID=A0AAD4CQ05_ASPNN|nr:hypothetical protein FE257_005682 [Aspergillus nanangensis]
MASSPYPQHIPYWRLLTDPGAITNSIITHPYPGAGTTTDPFIVEWIPNDPRNPLNLPTTVKWSYTITVAFAVFGVSLASSAYAGAMGEVVDAFALSPEVATLGVSLFVLGFAVGPLLWAPLSELVGRQVVFLVSYFGLAAFCAGAAAAQNPWTLMVLRFLAGAFGSSPLTNAGGVIADIFAADQRGLATSLFAGAPFLGPTLGPVIGGFLGQSAGWRWVQGFLAAFTGLIWLVESLLVPETYAPLLLRKRADRLCAITGKVYCSRLDVERGRVSVANAFGAALLRPWILLFREPIVLVLSLYMAIIYGTLYMLFDAFPIVFQDLRGWNEGVGSLPFLGVMTGMMLAVLANMYDNRRYVRIHKRHGGFAPPEARLPPTMVGAVAIPIGLFWFAWTNGPSTHWMVSIVASAPFGFGMVLVFLNIMTYLIDAYTIYAASVLAANSVIRSCFGAGFPLFTTYMYQGLGIHWASCVPAFLAVVCLPFPFVFYRYGAVVRRRCKYAAEADGFMRRLAEKSREDGSQEVREERKSVVASDEEARRGASLSTEEEEEEEEEEGVYQANPYDIDRVNTRNSAITQRSSPRRRLRFLWF